MDFKYFKTQDWRKISVVRRSRGGQSFPKFPMPQAGFFVDFEGNLRDSAVKNALRGMEAETSYLKILGNY